MNLIRFRKVTQDKYDSITPDSNTLYLITDSNEERLYLGNHLFNSRALVDVVLDTDNGKWKYQRNDGTDTEIDTFQEYIFDPERSYYDHDKKSIIMVFQSAPDDVTKPLSDSEIDDWALEIDLDDLSEKILNEVDGLRNDLSDGTNKADGGTDYLVVKFAEYAEKDYDGNTITSTYTKVSTFDDEVERLDNRIDERYTKNEVEQLLDDYANKHGLESDDLTDSPLADDDTFDDSNFDEVFAATLSVKIGDEYAFRTIEPHKFENDEYVTINVTDTNDTATFAKTDSDTWTFTSSDTSAEMEITGLRVKEITVEDVTDANAYVDVDNQDEDRTDKLKFAVIDGLLNYDIEEGD